MSEGTRAVLPDVHMAKALTELSIGTRMRESALQAELSYDSPKERWQQISLSVSGTAGGAATWSDPIPIPFDIYFFCAPGDRDTDMIYPLFNVGSILHTPSPVVIHAYVSSWILDGNLTVQGANIVWGAWAPDQPSEPYSFTGALHLSFQGYGAPPDVSAADLEDSPGTIVGSSPPVSPTPTPPAPPPSSPGSVTDIDSTNFNPIANFRTLVEDWDFTSGMPSPWGFNNGGDPAGYNDEAIPTFFTTDQGFQDSGGAHIGLAPHSGGGYDAGWMDSNGGELWSGGAYSGFEPGPDMRIRLYAQMPRYAGHMNAAGIWMAVPWIRGQSPTGDYQEVDGDETLGDDWTQLYETMHHWQHSGEFSGSPYGSSPYPANVVDLSAAPYIIDVAWESNSPANTGPQISTAINNSLVSQSSGLPAFFASIPSGSHNKIVCNFAANPGGVFGGAAFDSGNNSLLPVYATITRMQILVP